MKYGTLLLIFLFFLSSYPAAGKSARETISELEKELQTAQGKQKIEILNDLAKKYRKIDVEKSLAFSNNAIELSVRLNYLEGKADSYLVMGSTYYREKKNLKKAITLMKTSLDISTQANYKRGIIWANSRIAEIYRLEARGDEALKYFLAAEKLCENLEDNLRELEYIYKFTGFTYYSIKDYDRALLYYKKGLAIVKQAKKKGMIGWFFCYIGNVYYSMGKYEKTLHNYKESLKIFEELDNEGWINDLKQNIGLAYNRLERYDLALSYLLDVLQKARGYGNKVKICQVLSLIGDSYIGKAQYEKAEKYYREALEIIPSLNETVFIVFRATIYKNYADLCYKLGKFKEAYDSLKKHMEIDKENINSEKSKKIAELQERFDAEIREKEIEILKKDKRIQQILFTSGFLLVFIILAFIFKKYIYLFAFWKRKNQIGHYRVIEKIASGGMGTIYKAHDIQDKSKELALKVLRDEYFSDESYKRRFKHEALVIDQFAHPNIVRVIERGEAEGNIYIAMELLKGKNLNEVLEKEGRFAIPTALNIMIQAADALAMIHKKKIIHRDLKPENIMIVETGENPYCVKILDFGLAKHQTLTRMTQTGIIMGSISYLSPERMTNSEITPASDIYSLGVIFYQMLSGEMLFLGDTVVDIARQILEKEPIPLKKLRRDIPVYLNRLITRMIAKEPEERPTAQEVLTELKKISESFHLEPGIRIKSTP